MSLRETNLRPPCVQLVGVTDHPDFSESLALFRATASINVTNGQSPQLIVVAQSRPGEVRQVDVEAIQRRHPLSGIVAILGSWCEGETRTGRPWPGVTRLYWYEFPSWWRRQLALWNSGRCPDWARSGDSRSRIESNATRGLLAVRGAHRETAVALTEVLARAGYATAWERPGCTVPLVRGATAGIWDGGQLNDHETLDLAGFCRRLARDATPVLTLLDFPRYDSVERALDAGAAAVLGKPWLNDDLISTLQTDFSGRELVRAA